MTYSPNISEVHIPFDGGWTEGAGAKVLLLSVPSFPIQIPTTIHSFSYTWLYETDMDAYILCIQINKKEEFGLQFAQGEAGQLLLDGDAYGEFSLVITTESLEKLTDETPYLSFPKISLTRSIKAGW